MKKSILTIQLALITILAIGQTAQDSLKQKALQGVVKKFPRIRILDIQYGQSLGRDFDSELFGQKFKEGNIKKQQNFNLSSNLPFYKSQKLVLIANADYRVSEFEFEDVPSTPNTIIFEENGTVDFQYFSTGITAVHFSKLFNKRLVSRGSIFADGNDNGFQRVKGALAFTLMLKKTNRTKIGVGALILANSQSQLPYLPTFVLDHKFKNSKWELDIILPKRIFLQRPVGESGRVSLGTTLDSKEFYVSRNNLQSLGDVQQYTQLEIKTGIRYDHHINDYIIGTFQGGVQSFYSSQLTEKGEPSKDYIYKNDQDLTGYFQFGISLTPFFKKKSN